MSSTTASRAESRHRMPAGRWFAEIGWRHVVGVLAAIQFRFTNVLEDVN